MLMDVLPDVASIATVVATIVAGEVTITLPPCKNAREKLIILQDLINKANIMADAVVEAIFV